jgi:hypothetical protein
MQLENLGFEAPENSWDLFDCAGKLGRPCWKTKMPASCQKTGRSGRYINILYSPIPCLRLTAFFAAGFHADRD